MDEYSTGNGDSYVVEACLWRDGLVSMAIARLQLSGHGGLGLTDLAVR